MNPENTNQPTPAAPAPASPTNTTPVTPAPESSKSIGPVIATLVIVLILIIAALYLFASKLNAPSTPNDTVANQEQTEVQPVTNESDDVDSIESDLNASVEGLDGQNF